ncbi:MAG TPA: hypothetical protein VIL74_07900 [Pyrinomonadaceae bacterium]|jgi:hypothetical protein
MQSPQRFFLYLLIASVAASALIGAAVFAFGTFAGDFEIKILLTTLTVTVTSILGLACGAYLETGRGKILPLAGIALALVSCVLWIFLVWNGTVYEKFFAKLLLSLTLLAAACSHVCLLSLATLDRRFRWANYALQAAVSTLTAILLVLIWGDFENATDFVSRIIGVLSIVIAALTITIPIFHWLSRDAPGTEEIDAEIARLRARLAELEKLRGETINDAN